MEIKCNRKKADRSNQRLRSYSVVHLCLCWLYSVRLLTGNSILYDQADVDGHHWLHTFIMQLKRVLHVCILRIYSLCLSLTRRSRTIWLFLYVCKRRRQPRHCIVSSTCPLLLWNIVLLFPCLPSHHHHETQKSTNYIFVQNFTSIKITYC